MWTSSISKMNKQLYGTIMQQNSCITQATINLINFCYWQKGFIRILPCKIQRLTCDKYFSKCFITTCFCRFIGGVRKTFISRTKFLFQWSRSLPLCTKSNPYIFIGEWLQSNQNDLEEIKDNLMESPKILSKNIIRKLRYTFE